MKILFIVLSLFSVQSFAAKVCFRADNVQNFTTTDATHLQVISWGKRYTIETSYCRDLPMANRIGFQSYMGDNICKFDYILVLDLFSNQVRDRCMITNITQN